MDLNKIATVDCYYPPMVAVSIQGDSCRCTEKKCLYVCPSGIFIERGDRIVLNRDGVCLECGACRLVCENVTFDYPPAGRGVFHRFG